MFRHVSTESMVPSMIVTSIWEQKGKWMCDIPYQILATSFNFRVTSDHNMQVTQKIVNDIVASKEFTDRQLIECKFAKN